MENKTHGDVVNEIVLAIGSLPYARVWKNASGVATGFSGNKIRFGLVGSPDIIGILNVNGLGLFLGLEVKVGRDKQSVYQINFEKMVKSFGGLYFVCHSKSDALAFVTGAAKGSWP